MSRSWLVRQKAVMLTLSLVVLAFSFACGTSADRTSDTAAPTPEPTSAAALDAVSTPVALPAETAPATAPAGAPEPSGTLDVGWTELGRLQGHPRLTASPAVKHAATSIGEGLLRVNEDRQYAPMLAESWSVSDDFTTWTFKLRQGVQLQKGYGEMTSEDVVYSYRESGQSQINRARDMELVFGDPEGNVEEGYVETPDSYTLVVSTGTPWLDVYLLGLVDDQGDSSAWIVSKKQSEELGTEAASEQMATTGPWEILGSGAENWQLGAVENHWRQTPYFAEMIFWEIPEESSRIAGLTTGLLDTTVIAFDSIPVAEGIPGVEFLRIRNAGFSAMSFYGQMYVGAGTADQHPGYKPELPWVAANPEVGSPEWEGAKKVRIALSMAIDRQAIVDTMLRGFGSPLALRGWAGHEHMMPPEWHWEFDSDGARELLAEAGYPDGFNITLVPAIRATPAEVEACEAVAGMWTNIGVDVRLQRIPWETIRPGLAARTFDGALCVGSASNVDPVTFLNVHLSDRVVSQGSEHPWLDERIPAALAEVDPVKRNAMREEIYGFMFENALASGIGLYSFDTVWPVGPDIDVWEIYSYADPRAPTGFEYISPR